MAKLISLQGATIVWKEEINSDFSGNYFDVNFYTSSSSYSYLEFSYYDEKFAMYYGLNGHLAYNRLTWYNEEDKQITFTGGVEISDETLINYVLENAESITGGIYEEEHTVQIINPQMYILPPTKVVGNDLVVSAEEVVVNEAKTSFNVVVNLETNPVGDAIYLYYLHINGEYVNSIKVAGSSTGTTKFSDGTTSKTYSDVTTISINASYTDSDYNLVSIKYKIDDDEQQTSSDPITITKDCTITFYIPWGD